MEHFSKLTASEAELLAMLMEECGEVVQACGKILRHGYESHHPFDKSMGSNRQQLAKELRDVEAIASMLRSSGALGGTVTEPIGAVVHKKCGSLTISPPPPKRPTMTKNDGGPAFPGAVLPEHPHHPNGMTLRDWLAGQAMAAMNTWMPRIYDVHGNPMHGQDLDSKLALKARAEWAYAQADALLTARDEG